VFDIPHDANGDHAFLALTVYDWDQIGKDSVLGYVELPNLDLTKSSTNTVQLQDKPKKGKQAENSKKVPEITKKRKELGSITVVVVVVGEDAK